MERARHAAAQHRAGFTLLEVLVALAIVGAAVAGVLQLASQSLRLLKVSSEHVAATQLADRLAREAHLEAEGMDRGDEGPFTWERKVWVVETPKDLDRAGAPSPQLFGLSVAVRWNPNRAVEVATMRTSIPGPLASTVPGQSGPPGDRVTPQTRPGSAGSRGAGSPLGGRSGGSESSGSAPAGLRPGGSMGSTRSAPPRLGSGSTSGSSRSTPPGTGFGGTGMR